MLSPRTNHIQVLKNLENSLQHYNTCLQLYNPSRYPRRWGIAALEMGMALGAMADLVERVSQAASVAEGVLSFYAELGNHRLHHAKTTPSTAVPEGMCLPFGVLQSCHIF